MPKEQLVEIMTQISQGNAGCATMLMELLKLNRPITFFNCVETLIRFHLTGSRAYMLWNDACDRNTEELVQLLEKIDARTLPIETVEAHLAAGYCAPFTPDEEVTPEDEADAPGSIKPLEEVSGPIKNDSAVAFQKERDG